MAKKPKKKMKRMAMGGLGTVGGMSPGIASPIGPAADPYGKGSERPGMKPPFPGRGMDKPVNPRMLNRYERMKEKFPSYSGGNTAPTTRGQFRTMMEGFRDYRDDQRDSNREMDIRRQIGEKFSKIAERFPGYKPTGTIDTKDELRDYMRGLGDYRRANPDIRPAKPQRHAPDVTTQTKRGGGLARKGVGMALANGGLVKSNGVAQRGKTRGKMC